ncbi:hypothetical protein [Methanosarcina spelaei]
MALSQRYKGKESCLKGIKSVKLRLEYSLSVIKAIGDE